MKKTGNILLLVLTIFTYQTYGNLKNDGCQIENITSSSTSYEEDCSIDDQGNSIIIFVKYSRGLTTIERNNVRTIYSTGLGTGLIGTCTSDPNAEGWVTPYLSWTDFQSILAQIKLNNPLISHIPTSISHGQGDVQLSRVPSTSLAGSVLFVYDTFCIK